jgi:hypothetical protein
MRVPGVADKQHNTQHGLLLETPVQGASVALQDGREGRLAVGD